MNRDQSYLIDIFESSKIILSYLDQKTIEDFLEDIQLQDSVIRRLEIIGEATSRISVKTQNLYPLIPSGEILSLENALNQPQIKHRETLKTINTSGVGDIPLFNLTAKFNKTTAEVETPPPTLGQHTEEMLKEFGYTEDEMKSFKEKGIV